MKKLELPAGPFKAYLFDCDGTIADTMPLHYVAWKAGLAPWRCEFPENLFYEYAGMRAARIIELLNERFGLSMNIEAVNKLKEDYYLSHLSEIQPIHSVVEHIIGNGSRGNAGANSGSIVMAVVSGSPRASVVKTLTALNLIQHFENHAILGAEDYTHAKPHPEPFLTAAKRLGVEPEHCLVFEDAELGIQSAQAAGMQWVKV
jgi:beta-phosphoglucomutase-like phosphatase (HAD superfamily)